MIEHRLQCGWIIDLPDDWAAKRDRDDGHYIFFPPDSDLTLHATPFHAEKDGVLAPSDVMRSVYTRTLRPTAAPRELPFCPCDILCTLVYDGTEQSADSSVHFLQAGFFTDGELLCVNIFGTDKVGCEQALSLLGSIRRTP